MDDIKVTLAEHPGLGHVRLCACNSIHLSIGPVTVTLAPEAFAQAAILIRRAMEELTLIVAAKEASGDSLQNFDSRYSRFKN